MATIEERANLSAIEDSEKGRHRDEYYISALADHESGFREGYIKGATEQKAIDIDKACEWLKMHLAEWSLIDDMDLENFRKAMEEE